MRIRRNDPHWRSPASRLPIGFRCPPVPSVAAPGPGVGTRSCRGAGPSFGRIAGGSRVQRIANASRSGEAQQTIDRNRRWILGPCHQRSTPAGCIRPGAWDLACRLGGMEGLAAELHTAASGYQSVISGLTEESWSGPSSMSMVAAVMPYMMWMQLTAAQCEEAASQATAATGAYETAFAMTVPPPLITANRVRLMTLIATNIFGQNTPAIMATETEYSEMWAQDATAMYGYAARLRLPRQGCRTSSRHRRRPGSEWRRDPPGARPAPVRRRRRS